MEYLDLIKKKIPFILKKVRENFKNESTIYEFVKDETELNLLLDRQELLINEYLLNFNKKIDENRCFDFYRDLDIPFVIVYKNLNEIKKELLIELQNEDIDKFEVIEFNDSFNIFFEIVAKVYLKKDIHLLKDITKNKFNHYLLFKTHLKFLNKIIKAVKDNKNYPLMKADECEFEKVLTYPESLMICLDKNLCTYLHDQHTIIHKLTNSFFIFYAKKKYVEAYLSFKDLKTHVLAFQNTITELYFASYSNLENSFFNLIELLLPQRDLMVTLIDVKNIKGLNKIYGEQNITEALNILNEKIQKEIHLSEDKNLLIKGVTSNFYKLNMNLSKDEYKNLINQLKKISEEEIETKNIKVTFELRIIGLFLKKFSNVTSQDILKTLMYMKKLAKEKYNDIYLALDKNEQKKAFEILNSRYNEKFIVSKIENEEIDIAFQPIYNVNTKEIYSLEVLVRIKDKDKLIPAGLFIDTVYELNLISKLDEIVLRRIKEKESLIKQVTERIFVNISFQSLFDKKYMDRLESLLKSIDLTVVLELTEQKIVENIKELLKIHNIYNIYFAVDDFGTGYSSLKTVIDFAKADILKILKIDGELIKDLDKDIFNQKIIKIVGFLSKEINVLSVGEYVENAEILELLRKNGIDLAQGYYLSMPKSIEDLIVEKLNGVI